MAIRPAKCVAIAMAFRSGEQYMFEAGFSQSNSYVGVHKGFG